jgi:hypothetical protein
MYKSFLWPVFLASFIIGGYLIMLFTVLLFNDDGLNRGNQPSNSGQNGAVVYDPNNQNKLNQEKPNQTNQDQSNQNNQNNQNKPTIEVVDETCAIFSPEDIARFFGISVRVRVNDEKVFLAPGQCVWLENISDPEKAYSFYLIKNSFSSSEEAKEELARSRRRFFYQNIPNLADEAIFIRYGGRSDKFYATIKWVDGNVVYTLSVNRVDGLEQPEIESKLEALVKSKFG